MKKSMWFLWMAVLVTGISVGTGYAGDKKLAQTGFQFLSVPTEARAAAMGEAFTTVPGKSSSILYNPANMARVNSLLDISVSRNDWIADISHLSGTFAFNPARGKYGVFGASVLSVNYGDFLGTMVDPTTEKGFQDTGTFSPSAFAFSLAYAISLTDRFSVGGDVRYVYQKLGNSTLPVGDVEDGVTEEVENFVEVVAFDFGTLYRTGFKSLAFGMSVRNFSEEVKFQKEGFQLPLTFTIGVSMDVFDLFLEENGMHSFLISADAIHPRAYTERLNIGGEYVFMDMLALRAGYQVNYDEHDATFGFGVQKDFGNHGIAIDYAYTPFGVFDNVQLMSFRLTF